MKATIDIEEKWGQKFHQIENEIKKYKTNENYAEFHFMRKHICSLPHGPNGMRKNEVILVKRILLRLQKKRSEEKIELTHFRKDPKRSMAISCVCIQNTTM